MEVSATKVEECHLYVLVCHRMLLVWTVMSLVCTGMSFVVTSMYSYVKRMYEIELIVLVYFSILQNSFLRIYK